MTFSFAFFPSSAAAAAAVAAAAAARSRRSARPRLPPLSPPVGVVPVPGVGVVTAGCFSLCRLLERGVSGFTSLAVFPALLPDFPSLPCPIAVSSLRVPSALAAAHLDRVLLPLAGDGGGGGGGMAAAAGVEGRTRGGQRGDGEFIRLAAAAAAVAEEEEEEAAVLVVVSRDRDRDRERERAVVEGLEAAAAAVEDLSPALLAGTPTAVSALARALPLA